MAEQFPDTDCRKCGSPMPKPMSKSKSPIYQIPMKITAYVCQKCGHVNDLTARKANKRKAATNGN